MNKKEAFEREMLVKKEPCFHIKEMKEKITIM